MNWLWQGVGELRRRRVFGMGAVYVIAAWVAVQVAAAALPGLEIPDPAIRYVWLAAFLGLPLALAFSWRYDITPRGLTRTLPTGSEANIDPRLRRGDYFILGLFGVLATGIIYQLSVQLGQARGGYTDHIDIRSNSIAVLPLENLSGDSEQAYFVDGMHETLISNLSRISGLAVTSRTSTRQFSDRSVPVRQIAAQLGVALLIEGSVYRVDDQVRISLQLIDAVNDRHLWGKDYERSFEDLLRMQSEVAGDIAQEVEVQLTAEESIQLAAVRDIDARAHDAYLRGRFHADRFTPQDHRLAMQYFESALELDRDNALAYVGLASGFAQRVVAGVVSAQTEGPNWTAAAKRAVELDAKLAEAQNALANVMTWYEWDWEAADAAFQRSIELNASYARSRIFYSHFLTAMGRTEEAAEHMNLALELDPLNSFFQNMYAVQLALAGQIDASYEQFRQTFERDPGLGFGRIPYMGVLYEKGLTAEAISQALAFMQSIGDQEAVGIMQAGYESGGFAGAMQGLAELFETRSQATFVKPMSVAMAHNYSGDAERVFLWLERAYEHRDHDMVYLNVLPFSDEVRRDPRFDQLLERMNIPH